MGLFSWLAGQKAVSATPGVLEIVAARQLTPFALGGTNLTNERVNSAYVAVQSGSYGWLYSYSPAVRKAIDYIARNVSQLGLKLYERVSDDEREHRGNHPAADALRNPNTFTPGPQFIFNLIADFLTYGNAYAFKFRYPTGDLALVNIPAHMVGLVGQSFFSVDAYRIWRLDGSYEDYPPERIIHWRSYDPQDPRRGFSPIETLREELATDVAIRQSLTELARNGLAQQGWLERPVEAPDWSNEARTRLEEDWANRAKNRSRAPVLEEGMSFHQGGVTPEDADLIAGRQWAAEQVSSCFGMKHVPPEGEEERAQFYNDVLPPLMDMLCKYLDLQVLQAEYGLMDWYFEFNIDEKLMGAERLKALTAASGRPVLLTNEARAMVNRPPVDGGDELVTPMNVVVGDNPRPSPQVMPIQNPNGPPQDGSHRTDQMPMHAGQASLNGNGHKALLARRAAQERRRGEYAETITAILTRTFQRQERAAKASKKALDEGRWNRELSDDLHRAYLRIVKREGEAQARRAASEFSDGLTVNYLRAKAEGNAQAVNGATNDALRAGENPFENSDLRAAPIGMSFATSLAAWAVEEAGRQTSDADRRMKMWVTTSANSAHPELDGEVVPLGELFSNGQTGPPYEHPGCACLIELQ